MKIGLGHLAAYARDPDSFKGLCLW